MRYTILALTVAIAVTIISCNNQQNTNEKATTKASKSEQVELQTETIYQKAGIIKVKDTKAVMVGYRQPGDDIFEISLDDIGKFTGHVCAGISSGYLMTKQALETLYPNGEIPVRGQISIAASAYTDHAEVAAYVVKARQGEGNKKESSSLLIDTNIEAPEKGVTIIFKRNDTGKMVKASFDKSKLMSPEKMQEMMPLKKKILAGKASDEEKAKFAENVQNAVKKVITDTPEGLITISNCDKYVFPGTEE